MVKTGCQVTTVAVINNIKAHIQLDKIFIKDFQSNVLRRKGKVYNNFIVIKFIYTFIIFPKKGFINITGIKNFAAYERVIPLFCDLFQAGNSNLESSKLVIDNISASGDFHQTVNLVKLQQMINAGEYPNITTHFDRNFFPGAFCKIVGLGTVTVFQSGKFVIVGSKCQEHVDQVTKLMSAIINELSIMNEMVNLSVSTVV